ncbi:MAG: 2-oxoacid:ferredoxin oxidoreductase subunit beta [Desulfovibrionales bacterium]|nr:2-oxoacid:ferredoxin oxidoreductase subunit beta [Desulfovibrionales bacterium]
MAQVTELIHNYLRHNKKFPHVYCAGCGHGIVLGSLIRSVHGLGYSKDDIVLVAGIGCSGRMAVYVDFNTVHTTHGRALTFATGIKMANPKLKVIVVMGDGDAMAIGGNHLIHAARRNIGLTALVLNNNIYGMTGGQSSPTSPEGTVSATAPFGQLERSFDIVDMAITSGASYVARGTVMHVPMLDGLISDALEKPGFNLVEILTPCHTQYGRKNKFKTVVDMYTWYKTNTMKRELYAQKSPEEQQKLTPIGVFRDEGWPGLETRYAQLRTKLQEQESCQSSAN